MYTPPFIISAHAINIISEISALIERYDITLSGTHHWRLRQGGDRIKAIHSSLAIEGNSLSESEVMDIINGKQVMAPMRQIQVVKNAIRVYDICSELHPFSRIRYVEST